jgi:hypothetical protein
MVLLAAVLMGLAAPASARPRCRPCSFGGLCTVEGTRTPCSLSQARCVPRRGVLLLRQDTLSPYASWTLHARRRPGPRGNLRGTLGVFTHGPETPSVPGFESPCDSEVCIGQDASFAGLVTGERLLASATYTDGASCDFDVTVAFASDPSSPNRFVCRDVAGTLLAEGSVVVGGIRLFGCRP